MGWKRNALLGVSGMILLFACGGPSEPVQAGRGDPLPSSDGDEEPNDGAEMTGLMGTIGVEQVNSAMRGRMPQLQRCLMNRMNEVAFLGGDVRLSFRIHTDGTVAWVFPVQSTFGDRAAEQCILEIAQSTRFAQPRGGEAEFTWGFGIDPPDDVRLPEAWDATLVGAALMENAPDLATRCGASGVRVTAYVAPGGRVLTAGGSTANAEQLAQLDCVLEAVRALPMPDPGSYPAKVTFLVR